MNFSRREFVAYKLPAFVTQQKRVRNIKKHSTIEPRRTQRRLQCGMDMFEAHGVLMRVSCICCPDRGALIDKTGTPFRIVYTLGSCIDRVRVCVQRWGQIHAVHW